MYCAAAARIIDDNLWVINGNYMFFKWELASLVRAGTVTRPYD